MNNTLFYFIALLAVLNSVGLIILLTRKNKPGHTPPPQKHIAVSPELIARLEEQTQAAFKNSVEQAASRFDHDIDKTSQKLNDLIVKLTTTVVDEELTYYRKDLASARISALQSLQNMQKSVEQQQGVLQSDMQEAIKKYQSSQIEKLDQKFATIVSQYIVEALGQAEADLGAQRDYLFANLERNKEALKKDIA